MTTHFFKSQLLLTICEIETNCEDLLPNPRTDHCMECINKSVKYQTLQSFHMRREGNSRRMGWDWIKFKM